MIDPRRLESLITNRTSGVIGVHLWGQGCDTEALSEIAQRHGLKLLFDAAHAFGCSHNGRMIGSFGTAEVFSFHATKFFMLHPKNFVHLQQSVQAAIPKLPTAVIA